MKKVNLFFALSAALLVAGQANAESMYPNAWVTECSKEAPVVENEWTSSYYSFHCFNPNNGDEAIFAKYANQETLTVAEQSRIKQVFKEINAALDTTTLDLATFDLANLGGYADWTADYEISFNKAVDAAEYKLAGSYAAYNEGAWVVTDGQTLAADSIVYLMSALDPNLKYYELVAGIPVFNCGIIGLNETLNVGKTLTVALYIYNPQDKSDKKLINETTYTFSNTPAALVNVVNATAATKAMINGKMVIVRDGKMFNALGAQL